MRYIILIALGVVLSAPAVAQQWCDPRTKGWGCYERWCAAQGGTVDRRTTACSGGGGGSRGYSGGGGGASSSMQMQMQTMQMMSNVFANLIGSFIEAANQAQEIARQVRAEAEQVWARQLAEEQQRLARAGAVKSYLNDDARQSMERAKAMAAKLASALGTRGDGGLPLLAVYEDRPDGFGAKVLKPYAIGDAAGLGDRERRQCANDLLDGAAASGQAGVGAAPAMAVATYGEAYFLSRQARLARVGGQLDVACSVPPVGAGKNIDPKTTAAADTMLETRNRTMEKMFERATEDAEKLVQTRQASQESEKVVDEAQKRQQEAAQKVETIKAKTPPPVAAPTPTAAPAPPAEDPLLAEAMAALRQSDEALAKAQQAAQAGKQAFDEAQKRLDETGRMVDRMGRGPDGLAAVNAQLFPGEKAGGRP